MSGHGTGMEFEIVTTKLFIENGPILKLKLSFYSEPNEQSTESLAADIYRGCLSLICWVLAMTNLSVPCLIPGNISC